MKKFIFLSLMIFVISSLDGQELASGSKFQQINYKNQAMYAPQSKHHTAKIVKDSVATEKVQYKVLKKSPTVRYNITKKGTGNNVIFSFYNGNKRFPSGFQLYTNEGVVSIERGKYIVRNASFPIKLTTYCSTINTNNWASDMAQVLNDFEIEFYEPGNWEVSFVR